LTPSDIEAELKTQRKIAGKLKKIKCKIIQKPVKKSVKIS
jgi:hypothetical protein